LGMAVEMYEFGHGLDDFVYGEVTENRAWDGELHP
jgi:hypothetical protein